MDWSLVLVSQGIETTIDHAEDGAGWGLLVARQDYTHALRTLRQYRIENRGWPWQQPVFRPGLLFDWGSLAWALLAGLFYWLNARTDLPSRRPHGQCRRGARAVVAAVHGDLAPRRPRASGHQRGPRPASARPGDGTLRHWSRIARGVPGGGRAAISSRASSQHSHIEASARRAWSWAASDCWPRSRLSLWRQTPHARKLILSGICGGVMLFVLLALAPEEPMFWRIWAGSWAGCCWARC